MPLDKSRIQGFGSDGPGSGGGAGGSTALKYTNCPQGHALRSWLAIQGWCDTCGRKVFKNERVMDCRQCNWYVCTTCCPQPGRSSAPDYSDGSIQGALDSFASQLGDAIDAAAADIQEMANDVKEFVVETMGLDEDEEESAPQSKPRKSVDPATVQQKQLAAETISKFCNNYPPVRVAPKEEELEDLWGKCSVLSQSALATALYDQLGYSSGEFEWQPRLRVLYILEAWYKKGEKAKDIALSAASQSDGLLQHLLEVQQCKERAERCIVLTLGKAKATEAGINVDEVAIKLVKDKEQQAQAKAKAKAKAAAKVDLLDMAAPAAAPAAKGKAKAKAKAASGAGDLMDLMSEPAPAASAPVPAQESDPLGLGDIFAASAAPAPATTPAAVPSSMSPAFDPSAPTAPAPGAAPGAAPGGAGAFGTLANGPAMPTAMSGYAVLSQATPYPAMGAAGGLTGYAALGAPSSLSPPAPSGDAFAAFGNLGGAAAPAAAPASGAPAGAAFGGVGGAGGLGGLGGLSGFGALGAPAAAAPPAVGFGATFGGPQGMGMGMSAPLGGAPKAAAPPSPSKYSIPAAAEMAKEAPLSSKTKDPFAFVTEHTGLGK